MRNFAYYARACGEMASLDLVKSVVRRPQASGKPTFCEAVVFWDRSPACTSILHLCTSLHLNSRPGAHLGPPWECRPHSRRTPQAVVAPPTAWGCLRCLTAPPWIEHIRGKLHTPLGQLHHTHPPYAALSWLAVQSPLASSITNAVATTPSRS